MATCLLALGSNLGDREATLRAALSAIDAAPHLRLIRHSRWYRSEPVGGPAGQHEFVNGAALVETTLEPLALLDALQQLETQHGRRGGERWGERTLDLDLVLYDDLVFHSARLTVPHPRMSFRRFVLEPAAEIAAALVHPVIGWTIGRLRWHVDAGADLAAIVSPSERERTQLAAMLAGRVGAQPGGPPSCDASDTLWPPQFTTWLRLGEPTRDGGGRAGDRSAGDRTTRYPDAQLPKLTILMDDRGSRPDASGGRSGGSAAARSEGIAAAWGTAVRRRGRGPTLWIRTLDADEAAGEALAAARSVWPHLGPSCPSRLELTRERRRLSAGSGPMGPTMSTTRKTVWTPSPALRVVTEGEALRRAVRAAQQAGQRVGLVPTMGALHEGHLSLVDAAAAECDVTVVTIFVNPAQFSPEEDYASYPRDLEADLARLRQRGCDLVFVPRVEAIYGPAHATFVEVGPIGQVLEGEFRPTHFRGVATIVLKLFQLAPADRAYFGQKDYQQTLIVRRFVDDLDVPIDIRVCPTVREPDGLAMSSRNLYLSAEERRQASALPHSLRLAERLAADGERDAAVIRGRMRDAIDSAGGVDVQYIELVADGTVTPVARIAGPTVVAIAAKVGNTRLIDNTRIS